MTKNLSNSSMEGKQISDHDLLIRVDEKLNNLSTDVKTMGDGLSREVVDLKKRVLDIEAFHAKSNAPQLVEYVKADHEWIAGYKLTYKLILGLLFLISLVIGIMVGGTNLLDVFAGK